MFYTELLLCMQRDLTSAIAILLTDNILYLKFSDKCMIELLSAMKTDTVYAFE